MNRLMNGRLLLVGLMALQCVLETAQATEVWHTAYLKTLYPQADGNVILVFEVDASGCTVPGPGKYHYVTVNQNGMTAEGAKKIYATAMMAFAMGKQISIGFDNATTFCYVNRITLAS